MAQQGIAADRLRRPLNYMLDFPMHELPVAHHEAITAHAANGDALAERGQYEQAIAEYNKAWSVIPEPKNQWEASTWLLAAIGDACFLSNHFTSGSEALQYALSCPGGLGNPFIHLRLGQCKFECGHNSEAAEHLARAYMLEGKKIFANDAPKYFEYVKTTLQPPASGVW